MTDDVEMLDVPWISDGGAPMPILYQPEGEPARLVFRVAPIAPTTLPLAVVRFPGCWALKFGYPNDEALPGHPLYDKGLSFYKFHEVFGSSWLLDLHEQNQVSFPTRTEEDSTSRHFVVTFHDSTFECLSDGIEGRFVGSLRDAMIDGDAEWESA